MRPSHTLPAFAAMTLIAVLATLLLARRLEEARARTHDAIAIATEVEADVARLARLRAAQPTVGDGAQPQADALILVTAALDHAGLPSTSFRSLAPAATSAAPRDDAAGLTTARLQLILTPITLPDLGAFLHAWRATQRIWTIERIDLRPEPRGTRAPTPPSASDTPRWAATIGLRASYLQELGTTTRGASQ